MVAGPSGLVDTATNEAVVLSVTAGGVVEGRTAVSDDLVFTVSVAAAGTVTLDQHRAVVHTPDSGPDQSTTLAAANLVTLTATITDKDGDGESATLDIGQNLVFEDDAPTISTTGTPPTLTVDETVLTTDASASFAANFSSAFGADGAGTLTYALGVVAGPSGLVDTATNEAVILSVTAGGVVEGRTAVSDDLVFTVSVDCCRHCDARPDACGRAYARQRAGPVDHAGGRQPRYPDGDHHRQGRGRRVGHPRHRPEPCTSRTTLRRSPTTGTPPELTVDETVLTTDASASFAANFSSAFGADGAGTLTYALGVVAGPSGLVDTATNEAVILSVTAGGVVEGRTAVSDDLVFTVSVDC